MVEFICATGSTTLNYFLIEISSNFINIKIGYE